MSEFDVIILGGGPGGYIAGERLGHAGQKVLLVEADALGGTCLNVGCIPTKTLINAAKTYHHALHGAQYGVDAGGVSFDWNRMQAWKSEVVGKLVAGVGATQKRAGVTVINGHGTFEGPGRVSVNGETHTSRHVILATGSEPVMPPIPGTAENPHLVDSTGLLELDAVPERLVVIGGGVIGVEFASLFSMLGTRVTVIEMLPEIVPFMDAGIAPMLRDALTEIDFRLGCRVTGLDGGTVAFTTAAGTEETIDGDVVLMAVGRRPVVQGWGAEDSGLEFSGRGIVVDDRLRTNLPNVWAIGDVTGRSLLAHTAYRMGEVAAANILDPEAHRRGEMMRWSTVPWAVYSNPEAAGVGMTEESARAAGHEVLTATVPGYMSGRFVAENGFRSPGGAKVIVDANSLQVLGIHVLGSYAAEMIWGACAVLETELDLHDLRQVVIPHPTVSELIREAAWAIKA
ncbi:dihydrolipoyl dehydrogenase [Tessaracoccus sp.]